MYILQTCLFLYYNPIFTLFLKLTHNRRTINMPSQVQLFTVIAFLRGCFAKSCSASAEICKIPYSNISRHCLSSQMIYLLLPKAQSNFTRCKILFITLFRYVGESTDFPIPIRSRPHIPINDHFIKAELTYFCFEILPNEIKNTEGHLLTLSILEILEEINGQTNISLLLRNEQRHFGKKLKISQKKSFPINLLIC